MMKRINNSKELNEELERLKALSCEQDIALVARLKEIEVSLQPQNLFRQGITGLLKRNQSNHSLIPVLVGAGVEAGLERLLNSKTVQSGMINFSGAGTLQKLISSVLGSGELIGQLKRIFSPAKIEENKTEK